MNVSWSICYWSYACSGFYAAAPSAQLGMWVTVRIERVSYERLWAEGGTVFSGRFWSTTTLAGNMF